MRFKLDDSLFDNVENYSNIQEFLNSASRKNNQIVIVTNPEGAGYLRYREKIGKFLMGKSDIYLSKTISQFHLFRSDIYTVVDGKYAGGERISISQAIDFISRPFYIYLENDTNDKNFLKFFCDETDLRTLNDLEGSNELDYFHSGGIGELKKKVVSDSFNSEKSFVLFDSDSLPLMKEQTINESALAIKKYAEEKKIKFHMLSRRFIESYLPAESLKEYIYRDHNDEIKEHCEPKNKRLYDAFLKIECKETRYHFNLKNGIKGDAKRYDKDIPRVIANHYKMVDVKLLDDLMGGFGNKLSSSYESKKIKITDKMKDKDAWDEINGVVKSILRVI